MGDLIRKSSKSSESCSRTKYGIDGTLGSISSITPVKMQTWRPLAEVERQGGAILGPWSSASTLFLRRCSKGPTPSGHR